MPQESIYYAIGRLSVMQKNTLDASKLERLLQAPTAQEARRTLSERFGIDHITLQPERLQRKVPNR